ncbi:MAG: hypothetical protein E7662_06455 [Ruminococcaceae bacterium]|nr:hypothetical protein [Oscillospiraceae bacterium]
MEFVSYKAFGAKGDGKTSDIAAIIAAHAYANEHSLPVKAEAGAVYYIPYTESAAVVRTDTDWTGASFILDDREIPYDKRGGNVFSVESDIPAYHLDSVPAPKKLQAKLDITLPEKSMVILVEEGTMRYRRKGGDANNGSSQRDSVVVDTDGTVDASAPIIWDYKKVTSALVKPIPAKTLTLRGGTFTTITAEDIHGRSYYGRGISITRSDVTVDGLTHFVDNRCPHGAPYSGILQMQNCAYITVKNCTFTPHLYFRFNLPDGRPYGQGTYDITAGGVVGLTFENCRQTIDILDSRYWGVMGTNFCKNMVLKECIFSRFDAHQGVANVTITGCSLGYQGTEVIGLGTVWLEDTTLHGSAAVALRPDFGSHWEGDMVIRNCTWIPNNGRPLTRLHPFIGGSNTEDHDFGYDCTMPHTITIDGLHIDDSRTQEGGGICLIGYMNHLRKDEEYEAKVAREGYPYQPTGTLKIRNLTTATGRECIIAANQFMFRNMNVIKEEK